jgi:hypothetical protein
MNISLNVHAFILLHDATTTAGTNHDSAMHVAELDLAIVGEQNETT